MFVFLLTTLNTLFIWSFSASVWFKHSKHTFNIDSDGHQIKHTKNTQKTVLKQQKSQCKKLFFTSLDSLGFNQFWTLHPHWLENELVSCDVFWYRVWSQIDGSILFFSTMLSWRLVGAFYYLLYYCNMVVWSWSDWTTVFILQCYDTVGCVIWPVKTCYQQPRDWRWGPYWNDL